MTQHHMKELRVKIPECMFYEIDELVDEGVFGYSGRTEFAKDALRRHIERMRGIVEHHK